MKNIGVILLFAIMFLLPLSSAEVNVTLAEGVDKAYACVENQISSRSSALSLQEAIFSVLALGANSKAEQKIESEKASNGCWPKASCKIKDTAQALLAYDRLGKSTGTIESYLLSRNGTPTGIDWNLLIDISNHEPATCTIKQGSSESSISIGHDMKISGSPGNCLSITDSGYWLKISSSCLNSVFEISCSKDFITTILYQKTGSDTIYVSPTTHSAASSGRTQEKVNARCFKEGSECDYEGSLWAAFALSQAGKDITPFIPYLAASASENEGYFPDAILHRLTGGQDYYSSVTGSQQSNQYWFAPSSKYNKFYDTALALLGLQGKSSQEADNAKNYLLSVQTAEGCWNNNNLRDTSFLLYAGWEDQGPVGGGTSSGESLCGEAGFFCEPSAIKCQEAGGEVLGNYFCSNSLYCCSKNIVEQSCSQQGGKICSSGEECSGKTVSSSQGSCCLAQCETVTSETNECETSGGACRTSCYSDEQSSSLSCSASSDICCQVKSGGSSLWIIVLVTLIILAVLAIVLRNRLKLLFFKAKRPGYSSTPIQPRRPYYPPSSPSPMIRRQPSLMPSRRPTAPGDKDMEETLNKLRDMSK